MQCFLKERDWQVYQRHTLIIPLFSKRTRKCIYNSTVPKSDFHQIVITTIENSDEYWTFRSIVNSFSLPISETK